MQKKADTKHELSSTRRGNNNDNKAKKARFAEYITGRC